MDVAFLALHGRYGEDGTIQGTLDLLGVPYVGSGTLASALAMDKVMAKKVLAADGVPVPRGLVVERAAFRAAPEAESARAAAAFLPAVTKPARQGSSIGMSLVESAGDMRAALERGFAHDARVLVEERLLGTELTVGVLGNDELQALPVVEIVPRKKFFDYEAKYDPELTDEICPARIPKDGDRAGPGPGPSLAPRPRLPRALAGRHDAHRERARGARGEHHAGDDRQQPAAQGREGGGDLVPRAARPAGTLGPGA